MIRHTLFALKGQRVCCLQCLRRNSGKHSVAIGCGLQVRELVIFGEILLVQKCSRLWFYFGKTQFRSRITQLLGTLRRYTACGSNRVFAWHLGLVTVWLSHQLHTCTFHEQDCIGVSSQQIQLDDTTRVCRFLSPGLRQLFHDS